MLLALAKELFVSTHGVNEQSSSHFHELPMCSLFLSLEAEHEILPSEHRSSKLPKEQLFHRLIDHLPLVGLQRLSGLPEMSVAIQGFYLELLVLSRDLNHDLPFALL